MGRCYKDALPNISKLHYFDAKRNTRDKSDASHKITTAWGPHLNNKLTRGVGSNLVCIQVPKLTRKKYSINEIVLLAVESAVDRYKRYLLGKEFTITTDQKALFSALDQNKSNKTFESRLTRWVDRLLPFQFKKVHIRGKDMGIVDYLLRDPYNPN